MKKMEVRVKSRLWKISIPLAGLALLLCYQTLWAAVTITRAELSGGRLRVEGNGAAANATIVIDNGVVSGNADGSGRFRIEANNFTSASCVVTVSDGATTAQANLAGCTPTAPPTPTPSLPPTPTPTAANSAPGLLSPINNVSVTQPGILSWSAASDPGGATLGYNWQIATDGGFAAVVLADSVGSAAGGPVPIQAAFSGLADGAYFWRVQAVFSRPAPEPLLQGPWSSVGTFTVAGSGPTAPAAPAMTQPANGAQFHPLESFALAWSAVAGAANYRLEYDNEPSFNLPLFNASNDLIPGTQAALTFGEPVGTLYFRVRAVAADGTRGLPSAPIQVVITYNAPIPPPPALVDPANGAQVALPIRLDWTDTPNPQPGGYQLQVHNSPNFPGDFTAVELLVIDITASEFTVGALNPGTKYWRVRSLHGASAPNVAAVSAWSEVRSFTLPNTGLAVSHWAFSLGFGPPEAPYTYVGHTVRAHINLNQPAPSDTVVNLSSSNPALLPVPATLVVPGTSTEATFFLQPPRGSDVTVDTPVTLVATLGASTATTVLTVKPVALRQLDSSIDQIPGGGTGVTTVLWFGVPNAGDVVTFSSDSPALVVPPSATVLPEAAGVTIQFTTNPVAAPTVATITASWRGQSVQKAFTIHPGVTLLNPPTGAAFNTGQSVRFDWTDAPAVWNYQIQIDNENSFAAPLLVDNLTSTVSEYSSSTLPSGPLFWRVRWLNFTQSPSTWSEVRTITVSAPVGPLPAPVLRFPANNARVTVGQTVAFFWDPVAGAASYTLQVDNSSTFGVPFTLEQTVVGGTQVNSNTLPVGRYWWRVRANASNGAPGAWSAVRQLEIRR